MVEVFNNYKWIHLKMKGTHKSHISELKNISWKHNVTFVVWWDSRWSHVGSPPRPGLRTICGESGGGGSSGWDDRGACLVWGWVCQSTLMPSSSRHTPPTEGQNHVTNVHRDMYRSEALILGRQWPTLKLVMLEDTAEVAAWCNASLRSAQVWAQVPLQVVRASYPSSQSPFLAVWADTCTSGACWSSFLWFLPFLPAQRSQYGPAAVLLTSLSTWYNLSTFNLIFG